MPNDQNPCSWQPLGAIDTESLIGAREQLHRAIQCVANLGRTYLSPLPDYSHISLYWDPKLEALAGQAIDFGDIHFRGALRLKHLEILYIEENGKELARLALEGKTLAEIERWSRQTLTEVGLDGEKFTVRPPFEMVGHPLDAGGVFSLQAKQAAIAELAGYFANAASVLETMIATLEGAAPVRCWPHHFDIATLVSLELGDPETARSVNLGMSPGDGSYPQPYFYVTPWPTPDAAGLPPLPSPGVWHTAGWLGAVALAEGVAKEPTPEKQHDCLHGFYRDTYEICARLLAAETPSSPSTKGTP